MLAPLVVNLLYVCIFMLVSGWVYDILHARLSFGRRGAQLATGLPVAKTAQKWTNCNRTSSHA